MFLRWKGPEPRPRREMVPELLLETPVAPEWDEMVRHAEELALMVDQHLEYESALQGRELSVATLCPEQKTSLVSDLAHMLR